MSTARTSLVEQKRLQWAKEREEMSRLTGNYATLKNSSTGRTGIRACSNGTRTSLATMSGKQHPKYASTISLYSLASDMNGSCGSNLLNFDLSSGSLISLQDQNLAKMDHCPRRRSPSLPPIFTKDDYRCQEQQQQDKESSLCSRQSRLSTRTCQCDDRHRPGARGCTRDANRHRHQEHQRCVGCIRANGAVCGTEEREGETSGYGSDNVEGPPAPAQHRQQVVVLPCHVTCSNPDEMMGERTWQNPYYIDGNSLPSSRKLTSLRAGEFNRQRWGSVWGQDASKDLPPPSWLERGLSRLDHNSQLLVISHDSASSPDSSTTGSTGSDTNKTYLRGQNLPIDADILQEREIKRQKAIELQTAIKQQLVERENKRKEEREKKLKEERAEEERILRERDLEKKRFEEEQRHQREKEEAKLKKTKVMQEVLASAERKAKEEKQQRHRLHSNLDHRESHVNSEDHNNSLVSPHHVETPRIMNKETMQTVNQGECSETTETRDTSNSTSTSDAMRLPISQEVTILLSGRIEDPELLSKSSLKLVNLVVSPRSTGRLEAKARGELGGINLSALLSGLSSPVILQAATASRRASPCVFENRLLTPSKYRVSSGRDFGTQTDCEGEVSADAMEKTQSMMTKEVKERKEAANSNRREFDKSTNTGQVEESSIKSLNRNKTQARMSIESRPRWNANRPGTRYRTQSEKDPHYQRRMRLRRRQVETSDEGSSDFRRSPSPSRRKYGITKAKSRSSLRRKVNVENYDADLSMDSLNSLVPLHTDQNGRINIERCDETLIEGGNNSDSNIWCRDDILSHFTSLRNNVVMKKKEWDLEECPITPITELC